MNFSVNNNKNNYIKDYKNYLFYIKKKKLYLPLIILVISGVLFLADLLINSEFDFVGIAIYPCFLGLFFLLLEIISTLKALKSINDSANIFKFGVENLIIEPTQLKISSGQVRYETFFLSQITKCLILNNAMFLVFKSKNEWPIRINRLEIGEENFIKLVKFLERRQIKVEYK